MENNSFSLNKVIALCGAFISFTVGAGFASGNEILQFFGSWGDQCVVAYICALATTIIYCVCFCLIGRDIPETKQADIYQYFGGKIVGRLFQLTVFVFLIGNVIMMFSGAGSLFQQQWGLPQWVGSVALGLVAAVIVLNGLKTVENVLGKAGIVLLVYVLVFGILSFLNPDASFAQVAGAEEAVAAGHIMRANLFAVPPFSLIPGIDAYNSPWLEGVIYGALCICSGFPFYLNLGRSTSKKEAPLTGVAMPVSLYICVGVSLMMMLLNFDSLTNPVTGEMYPIPVLAVINKMWPAGSWTYVLIIFVGIFTSEAGYLWSLNDMFFKGREKTRASRLFVVALIVIGVFFGSRIPLSLFFQYLHPFIGLMGSFMVIAILIKTVRVMIGRKKAAAEVQ